MRTVLKTISALSAATLIGLSPVAALADPLGVYQTTDRNMDFGLDTCGADNKHLCVTLLAARGTAVTHLTAPYIGKLVVDTATPAGKNVWKGSMSAQGYTGSGTLRLNPGTNFVMHGCTFVVICSDFTLIPAS